MPSRNGTPHLANFHPDHNISVWAFPAGSILVNIGEKGPRLLAQTEPVSCLDVDFQNGMIVYADVHNTLHVNSFPGLQEMDM